MYLPINVVMKQQRNGAINKSVCIHTQVCNPARTLTCLPSCLLAGTQADKQTCQQAAPRTDRLKYNVELYGIKGVVLFWWHRKISNKCTIMERCSIFSIFQRNSFGNKCGKCYFCK